MEYVFGAITFMIGAALGSFVAVVADRYNTGLPFMKGRSFCFSCNEALKSFDMVPVFSFIFLRGKCRHCRSSISMSAFLSEIVMGAFAVLSVYHYDVIGGTFYWSNLLAAILLTCFFATVLLISLYDIRHFIIPDSFIVTFIFFALAHNILFVIGGPMFSFVSQRVLAGVLLALPFAVLFYFSNGKWIGFGDVKYIGAIGFFLGAAQGVSAVILAFWLGALVSVFAILLKNIKFDLPFLRKHLSFKSEIPFGPFLSLGIVFSFWLNLDLFQISSLFGI